MTEVATIQASSTMSRNWQDRGACRGLDTEKFFLPDAVRGKTKRMREANAKSICAECPVVRMCLEWALSVNEPYGVWGGTTPEERDSILAARYDATA